MPLLAHIEGALEYLQRHIPGYLEQPARREKSGKGREGFTRSPVTYEEQRGIFHNEMSGRDSVSHADKMEITTYDIIMKALTNYLSGFTRAALGRVLFWGFFEKTLI